MPLPRPASPRTLWADLRLFWSTRPRHQWFAATAAVLIPIAIGVGFYFDGRTNLAPRQRIQYIDSWRADRTDAEIMAKQKTDAAAREARRRARQREFQKLDEGLNRMGL